MKQKCVLARTFLRSRQYRSRAKARKGASREELLCNSSCGYYNMYEAKTQVLLLCSKNTNNLYIEIKQNMNY